MEIEKVERNDSDTYELVLHTRDLYAAILRARKETSSFVLKDLGDAIFDSAPWETLTLPVKKALVAITRELIDANTQAAIAAITKTIAVAVTETVVKTVVDEDIESFNGKVRTRFAPGFGPEDGETTRDYKIRKNREMGPLAQSENNTKDGAEAKAYVDWKPEGFQAVTVTDENGRESVVYRDKIENHEEKPEIDPRQTAFVDTEKRTT